SAALRGIVDGLRGLSADDAMAEARSIGRDELARAHQLLGGLLRAVDDRPRRDGGRLAAYRALGNGTALPRCPPPLSPGVPALADRASGMPWHWAAASLAWHWPHPPAHPNQGEPMSDMDERLTRLIARRAAAAEERETLLSKRKAILDVAEEEARQDLTSEE